MSQELEREQGEDEFSSLRRVDAALDQAVAQLTSAMSLEERIVDDQLGGELARVMGLADEGAQKTCRAFAAIPLLRKAPGEPLA